MGEIGLHVTIDEALIRHVGQLGPAQLRHFLLVNVAWLIEALWTFVSLFAEQEPPWRCTSGGLSQNLGGVGARCSPEVDRCQLRSEQWEWVDPAESVIAEFGLGCVREYWLGLPSSAFFLGYLIGAGLFGALSDGILGRKRAMLSACSAATAFGFLTAFAPSFWPYVFFRFGTGLGCGGIGLCAFVLSTEVVGPDYRGVLAMSSLYYFSLGIMLLPFMAWGLYHWRWLYLGTTVPTLLFTFLCMFFVTESPRWLLLQGLEQRALDCLAAFADGNGKSLPKGLQLLLDRPVEARSSLEEPLLGPQETGLWEALKVAPIRQRLLVMTYIWFGCALVYFGLGLNAKALSHFASLHATTFINGAVEVPGYIIATVLVLNLGRKLAAGLGLSVSGAACLAAGLLPHKAPLSVLFAFVGKMGISGAYATLYVYTAELFPTCSRSVALGVTTQAAQFGSILAPSVVALGRVYPAATFVVFGGMGLVAALLALLLPETRNQPLHETVGALSLHWREQTDLLR